MDVIACGFSEPPMRQFCRQTKPSKWMEVKLIAEFSYLVLKFKIHFLWFHNSFFRTVSIFRVGGWSDCLRSPSDQVSLHFLICLFTIDDIKYFIRKMRTVVAKLKYLQNISQQYKCVAVFVNRFIFNISELSALTLYFSLVGNTLPYKWSKIQILREFLYTFILESMLMP